MEESAFLLCKSQSFLQISGTPRVENPQIHPLEMPFAPFVVVAESLKNKHTHTHTPENATHPKKVGWRAPKLGTRKPYPKGPKTEKIQDRPPGLKFSSAPPTKPLFLWVILKVEIENFKRDCKCQASLKISSEIKSFQSLGPKTIAEL